MYGGSHSVLEVTILLHFTICHSKQCHRARTLSVTKKRPVTDHTPCSHSPCHAAGDWTCDYHDLVDELQGFGAGNNEGLAQLLLGFFQYWATQHDYKGQVLTVRSSYLMSKAVKGW